MRPRAIFVTFFACEWSASERRVGGGAEGRGRGLVVGGQCGGGGPLFERRSGGPVEKQNMEWRSSKQPTGGLELKKWSRV